MGSVTMKRLPLPSSLSSVTLPPCNSTNLATRAKPRPVPSCGRVKPDSICVNARNNFAVSSKAMPIPVSHTVNRTASSPLGAVTLNPMCPPLGVNLTALVSKFTRICFKRLGSTDSCATLSSCSKVTPIFFCMACVRTNTRQLSQNSLTFTWAKFNSNLPASTFDKSRMSLINESKCSPLL